MRIFEIASAEEQLALWKLISDNVWTTISQQARTEAQQRAAAAAKSRLKPKKPKKLKKPPRAPAPPKPKPQNKSAVPARPQTVNQPAKTQLDDEVAVLLEGEFSWFEFKTNLHFRNEIPQF